METYFPTFLRFSPDLDTTLPSTFCCLSDPKTVTLGVMVDSVCSHRNIQNEITNLAK